MLGPLDVVGDEDPTPAEAHAEATADATGWPRTSTPKASQHSPASVVLGVAGGIAAYKAVEVCRRLVDAGSHVTPVLTDDARRASSAR